MNRNGCQCVACACSAEGTIGAAADLQAVHHNHARLPGVLRYRGLVNEAGMAARLAKVELLIFNLRSVLGDLDASIRVEGGSSDLDADGVASAGGHPTREGELRFDARRQHEWRVDVQGGRTGMSALPKHPGPDEAMQDYAVSGTEPTLSALLDEPILHLLMARDAVTRGDLELLIERVRRDRLALRSATGHGHVPPDPTRWGGHLTAQIPIRPSIA